MGWDEQIAETLISVGNGCFLVLMLMLGIRMALGFFGREKL
jgi:hypothetical protein